MTLNFGLKDKRPSEPDSHIAELDKTHIPQTKHQRNCLCSLRYGFCHGAAVAKGGQKGGMLAWSPHYDDD